MRNVKMISYTILKKMISCAMLKIKKMISCAMLKKKYDQFAQCQKKYDQKLISCAILKKINQLRNVKNRKNDRLRNVKKNMIKN